MRIYYEMRHAGADAIPPDRIEVPTGVARWSSMARGGHFAALEEPELLAGELRVFFRELR